MNDLGNNFGVFVNGKKMKFSSSIITMLSLVTLSNLSVSADTNSNEESIIQNFLHEQPNNGEEKRISNNSLIQSSLYTEKYKFPGVENYTSLIQSRYLKEFYPDSSFYEKNFRLSSNGEKYRIIKVDKIFQQLEPSSDLTYNYFKGYYVKQIDLLNISTNQKETYYNALIYDSNYDPYIRIGGSQWVNDIAIEADDPRFILEIDNDYSGNDTWNWFSFNQQYDINSYWSLVVPEITYDDYDTIIKIDESLKSGQEIIDQEGVYGKKENNYYIQPPVNDSNDSTWYKTLFNSDVIIDELLHMKKDGVLNSTSYKKSSNNMFAIRLSENSPRLLSSPTNKIIRVGIDYTYYKDTNGKEIYPKQFGIQDEQKISGYKLLTSEASTNGDKTYIYEQLIPISSSTIDNGKIPPYSSSIDIRKTTSSTTSLNTNNTSNSSREKQKKTDVIAKNKNTSKLPSTGEEKEKNSIYFGFLLFLIVVFLNIFKKGKKI
ncbi:LPXTG cell wall anchor domain-containing protein [Lactococcus lactis]|uniref:LPXTG cell wall anchor domain-containing protein n=1 Tax=Lactococcus lactis TaxID=1358 RepID=UPI001EEF712C|nr:LPXTG cell wall anchor domain-containing protein [Lactococcus lactis]MCG1001718.1 LPXTG cell wall anchor domain-containing protein [Lactococcus lactis]